MFIGSVNVSFVPFTCTIMPTPCSSLNPYIHECITSDGINAGVGGKNFFVLLNIEIPTNGIKRELAKTCSQITS